MSESDITTSTPSVPGTEPPTQEIFIGGADAHNGVSAPDADSGEPPWDMSAADDDEWPERGPRQGVRMSVPTVVGLALLIALGGIWGGAALQRSHGTSSGTSTGASALASLFRSRAGAAGFGGTGTGAGATALAGVTTGTVTEVSGSTLYVTNASGDLVKVTVAPTVTVDRNAASSLGALQVGDTVVVEGAKASDGTVTATSVSATAAGVTSPFSRFGGAGGG
jgi:hypothetical protein